MDRKHIPCASLQGISIPREERVAECSTSLPAEMVVAQMVVRQVHSEPVLALP